MAEPEMRPMSAVAAFEGQVVAFAPAMLQLPTSCIAGAISRRR